MLKHHHFLSFVLIVFAIVSATIGVSIQTPIAHASCAAGATVTLGDPAAGAIISGIHTLHAYSSTAATGLSFMLQTGTNSYMPLGQGTLSGTDWHFDWDSRDVANGNYYMVALAHYGTDTTLDCASGTKNFSTSNTATQSPTLASYIQPGTWTGNVGQSSNFTVNAQYTDQYGRKSAANFTAASNGVSWTTTIGTLSATNTPSVTLYAGSVAGSGQLSANTIYNGLSSHATAAIQVNPISGTSGGSPTTTSPSPSPSPSPTKSPSVSPSPTKSPSPSPTVAPTTSPGISTIQSSPTTATDATIFHPAIESNSHPIVAIKTIDCIKSAVGQVRFKSINSGTEEPTQVERLKSDKCFSGPERIPATLAPVPPAHIRELESENQTISVTSATNLITTNSTGVKITGLLISGKGIPNSDIFIYIFSDPIVLRAQTDNTGAWKYVLESPLKSGKHEIFAVAKKESDTFVRTSALPIAIAAAAGSKQDGSLVLESNLRSSETLFGIAALFLIVATVRIIFIIRKRRHISPDISPAATDAPQA